VFFVLRFDLGAPMGTSDHLQLRGCMVDGFGEFDEADYRRSWLFFSNVDYVLPIASAGPLFFSRHLERNVGFDVLRTPLESAERHELIDAARRDAEAPWFGNAMAGATEAQQSYARLVVLSDDELKTEVADLARADARFSLSYLLNKLLRASQQRGLVPIVGQKYAADLLGAKVAATREEPLAKAAVLTQRQAVSVTPFAAGLSLSFLSDEDLVSVPFERLGAFKEANGELLEQHQLHILAVTQAFGGMPYDESFADRLAALRADAWKARAQLDANAKDAWLASGFKISQQAITAAAASFFSGLALLHGHTLHQIAAAAAPAAVAAIGVGASNWVDVLKKCREARQTPISYIFRARDLLITK